MPVNEFGVKYNNANINAVSSVKDGKVIDVRMIRFGLKSIPELKARKESLRIATESYLRAIETAVGKGHAIINVQMSTTFIKE